MRSVHLTNAFHPHSGGVRTMYLALLAAANRLRRHAALIVPGPKDDFQTVGEFARIYTLRTGRAPFDPRYRLILPDRFLFGGDLAAILRNERPDLIEICDKYSLFYVAGLIRKGWLAGIGRPTLIGTSAERLDDNVAAFISPHAAGAAARWYMRHLYAPMFDFHVVNSEYTAAEIRRALPAHRQRVVHVAAPGVDVDALRITGSRLNARQRLLQRLTVTEDGLKIVLYAGRLSPEKNVQLLTGTMRQLGEAERLGGPRCLLVVAGDGPSRARLEADLAQTAGVRSRFLGNIASRPAFADLLAAVDVFVHPNPREPFGIAPLEAMAAGTALVAPSAGGVLSYATPANAWLADPRPAAFAEAIRSALENPERHEKRRLAIRQAERFSMSLATERLFDLYDRLHQEMAEARTAFPGSAGVLSSHGGPPALSPRLRIATSTTSYRRRPER